MPFLETNAFPVYNPAQYISGVLRRAKKHHIARHYELSSDWKDATDFIEQLSRKRGRLLAGGEPDVDGMAVIVLNDFLRGKIPWFTPPPDLTSDEQKDASAKGREQPKKRKRDEEPTKEAAEASKDASEAVKEDDKPAADAEAGAEEGETEVVDDVEAFGTDSAPSDFGSDEDDLISLGSISDEESDNGDAADAVVEGDEDVEEGGAEVSSEEDSPPPKPQPKPKAKRQKR